VGYVLMPEHFHILLWPSELANPSQIMQKLEERTAKFILKSIHEKAESAWCQGMLRSFTLPATVHHYAHRRVWQRRFYDMNIWRESAEETRHHAQQSGEARVGGEAGRLVPPRGIELEVLLPGRQFGAGDGSDVVIAYMAKTAMYAPPGMGVRVPVSLRALAASLLKRG
jgi:REP element-mobilizing transposase RayT